MKSVLSRSSPFLPLSAQQGFVLWEMMLALAIFCIVSVALTTALHQTIDTAILVQDESTVRHGLENILAESWITKLDPGKQTIPVGDDRIHYEREVVRIAPKTGRGDILANLVQVTVRASWQAQGHLRTSEAQEVFYQP